MRFIPGKSRCPARRRFFGEGATGLALVLLALGCGGGAVSVGNDSGPPSPPEQTRPTYVMNAVAREMNDREQLANVTSPETQRYLTPAQVRKAYGLDAVQSPADPATLGAGQTIAIISAYSNPGVARDLAKFIQRFNLAPCDQSCLSVVYTRNGQQIQEPPATSALWSVESSLDVQWVHVIAPLARIVLVEAASSSYDEVLSAARFAATQLGANVVSMSFGGAEWSGQAEASKTYFANANATFVAASGDYGPAVLYPATSPEVLAVGGTTLSVSDSGGYLSEVAWPKSSGGLSAYESGRPAFWPAATAEGVLDAWAAASKPGGRPVPDVAYHANPERGFFSYSQTGIGADYYGIVGGTSAGTAQWAALIAVANAMRQKAGKSVFGAGLDMDGSRLTARQALARLSAQGSGAAGYAALFNDVQQLGNGTCGLMCNAAPGWDFVTGLGTPNAATLIPALVAY
jgi:subtilase family serine protease